MKEIIEDLYKFDRQLLGEGYDFAMDYIEDLLPLQIISLKSGTRVGDWVVPNAWTIKNGWIKHKGKKIADYTKNPLAVTVYSTAVKQTVTLEELKKHLHVSDECPDAYSYDYKFYDRDWGFSMPKTQVDKLEEGDYEVFIDSVDTLGEMRIGVHTIKGKSDREILLFAHLDHPHQANDNLSAVACLIDLAKQLKGKYEHTIKLIFCPETIGSIAYAETQDISKVDFVMALDSIGNDNTLLFQKAFDTFDRLNYCAHLAVAGQGVSYRKGEFRHVYGADEYYFNDPKVNIPGLFFTRLPFKEYHTSEDTPDKILIEKIVEVQQVIIETIEIYENDFIPIRNDTRGPIMRSRHGIQAVDKTVNRDLDFLYYRIDGKKWLSELVIGLGLGFHYASGIVKILENDKIITRWPGPSKK